MSDKHASKTKTYHSFPSLTQYTMSEISTATVTTSEMTPIRRHHPIYLSTPLSSSSSSQKFIPYFEILNPTTTTTADDRSTASNILTP